MGNHPLGTSISLLLVNRFDTRGELLDLFKRFLCEFYSATCFLVEAVGDLKPALYLLTTHLWVPSWAVVTLVQVVDHS